jgi:hypothetical protein
MAETETMSSRYRGLDSWTDGEILEAFWEGQARAIAAVRPALPAIAAAAAAMAERLRADGRLIYAGAGSSGRQAALDGMELGSTFGWPEDRVRLLMAEGPVMEPRNSGEAEDDAAGARRQIAFLVPQKAMFWSRSRPAAGRRSPAPPRRRPVKPARWWWQSPTIRTRRCSPRPITASFSRRARRSSAARPA